MHINDTQQEHSYHKFIQNFSSLFKKIKEDENLPPLFEDESICNAVVSFYTAKFLIEHADLDLDKDENKNKACEVILQECNKIAKEDRQELESEVEKTLKKYVDDVKDVSIYGNHASITLEDNKKEFKISEFLNSDFCEKNGISGFSTLHSDGKSGMHGFVAEEGEGKEKRKVRHYVVTDGSYEMTLNWYDAKGEKCTIKINIDKEGVELIEGNGVTEDQLKANKDVKIGDLSLYEALKEGKWKEVQHGKEVPTMLSSETFIESDVSRGVGVQTAHINRGIGSQTPPKPPLRTSSLPKGVFNQQGGGKSLNHQDAGQRSEKNSLTPDNQQQPGTQQQEKGEDLWQDIRDFNKNNLRHTGVDGREASIERSGTNDSSTDVKTAADPTVNKQPFSFATPNSKSDSDYSSPTINHSQSEREQAQQVAEENISKDLFSKNVLEKIKEDKPIYEWLKNKIEGRENNQNLDALEEKLSQKSGQGNIVEKREKDSGEPLSSINTEENIDAKQSDGIQLPQDSYKSGQEPIEEELNYQNTREALESWKEKRLNKYIINEDVKENIQEKIQSELQKDSSTDVETVESKSTPYDSEDSGYSTPTIEYSQSGVDPEDLTKKLEDHEVRTGLADKKLQSAQIITPADQVMSELKEVLEKPNRGLTEPEQWATKENTSKDSFSEHILENINKGEQYDPIRQLLKKKIGGQDNIITAATELGAAVSELCTEAQKGFKQKQPWTERIAKPQQEKDTKGIPKG